MQHTYRQEKNNFKYEKHKNLTFIYNNKFEPIDTIEQDCYVAASIIDSTNEVFNKVNTYNYQYYHPKDEEVMGYWIPTSCNQLKIFYVHSARLTRVHPKTCRYLGSIMTGVYCYLPKIYSQYSFIDECLSIGKKQLDNISNDMFVYKKQFIRQNISLGSHTLLRPEEVLSCMCAHVSKIEHNNKIICAKHNNQTCIKVKLANYLISLDDTQIESTISTLLLYSALVSEVNAMRLIGMIEMCLNVEKDIYKILKSIGLMAKQIQYVETDDLNELYELAVLQNRIDTTVNWDKEIANRTVAINTVSFKPSTVYKAAKAIFIDSALDTNYDTFKDWESYWQTRWASLPTGSYVSQYAEDKDFYKKLLPKTNINKTSVLSTIKKPVKFEHYYNRPREIFASTSQKWEWAKVRALYGCDITSFIMSDFGMGGAEQSLPQYFVVGSRATDKAVKQKVKQLAKCIPLCYDYDDFNSQHSKQSMKEVITAWIDVHRHRLSNEQVKAAIWTRDSVNRLYFHVNQHGYQYNVEAEGTLYSGWRLTSFMNTVLNRVYLELSGIKELTAYSIHNGDDVLAAIEIFDNGLKLIENTEKNNLRAQTTKMSYGTIGEFLRIDGLATKPTGSQYLTRACATATHSKVESDIPNNLESVLKANQSRCDNLVNRGGDVGVVLKIRDRLSFNATKIFNCDVQTINMYYQLHPVQGGCNTQASVSPYRIKPVTTILDTTKTKQYCDAVAPGANDYLNYLAKTLSLPITLIDRRNINEFNKSVVRTNKTSLVLNSEGRHNINHLVAGYKVFKTSHVTANVAKVRLLGTYNVILRNHQSAWVVNYLKTCKKPFEMMSIIC